MKDLEKRAQMEIPAADDLTVGDMEILFQKAEGGKGGLWDAISTAYTAGYAVGVDRGAAEHAQQMAGLHAELACVYAQLAAALQPAPADDDELEVEA